MNISYNFPGKNSYFCILLPHWFVPGMRIKFHQLIAPPVENQYLQHLNYLAPLEREGGRKEGGTEGGKEGEREEGGRGEGKRKGGRKKDVRWGAQEESEGRVGRGRERE